MNEDLLIIDTETTDVDRETCGVVQLSAVLFQRRGEKVFARTVMNTRCKPGKPIGAEAAKIHGISQEDVQYAPAEKFVAYTLHLLMQTMPPGLILGSHNGQRFDVPILDRLCPDLKLRSYPHIDTFLLGRRWFPTAEFHKLEYLYPMVTGKEASGAHDAAFDCYMVAALINSRQESYQELAEQCAVGVPYTTMPFGKHKGDPWEKVPMGYVRYIYETFDDIDKDCLASVIQRYEAMGLDLPEKRLPVEA